MSRSSPEQIPTLALWLGYAGLLPFIGLMLGLWFAPERLDAFLMRALLSYSAVILSFMGAIHWALAMHAEGDTARRHMTFSVLPALIGWGLSLQYLRCRIARFYCRLYRGLSGRHAGGGLQSRARLVSGTALAIDVDRVP